MAETADFLAETALEPDDFDPEALRQKYREERDRRLRPDGIAQYIETKDRFDRYKDDPWVSGDPVREPVVAEVEMVVIGGGFGGLIAAARAREAGVQDIHVIDQASDFGGTWYWNRYPGAQCDIESYMYMPLLEETGYIPTQKYATGVEIQTHARRIGEIYDLYRDALFRTTVTDLSWSEPESRWIVTTDRSDRLKARFVALSSGPFNRPKLPGIPGIETFQGHSFHTSRWDYGYTGGDTTGGLHRLADKRVAVIGTGASAIQCVPPLGEFAQHLFVFQRTPSCVDHRGNQPTDPEWVKTLTPGWQRARGDNFLAMCDGRPQPVDLVNDAWTEVTRSLGNVSSMMPNRTGLSFEEFERVKEMADFRKMNRIRARIDAVVKDRKTAEALKPWYRYFCKRPCFSDEFLDTFNRPNVTLVDTMGQGVERITERGPMFGGTEYPVDCIIFATGFEVGTGTLRTAGHPIRGRGGKTLAEHWKNGLRTLHGLYSHGFPNLFQIGFSQNGLVNNFVYMANEQGECLRDILRRAYREGAAVIEPTAEAESEWVDIIRAKAANNRDFVVNCTPSYYNNEGKVSEGTRASELYGGGGVEFYTLFREWRRTGMVGLKFS